MNLTTIKMSLQGLGNIDAAMPREQGNTIINLHIFMFLSRIAKAFLEPQRQFLKSKNILSISTMLLKFLLMTKRGL